jgi:hypothetical protein
MQFLQTSFVDWLCTPQPLPPAHPEIEASNEWKPTRQRKPTPIPSERSFTGRFDTSSVYSILATSHNQAQSTATENVLIQQQQSFPTQSITNLAGQQQLQPLPGQPIYTQTHSTQAISFVDASTVLSTLQESLQTKTHSFVLTFSYNLTTSALTLQFQFVHQSLIETLPEIINSIVDNLPDNDADNSHNEMDEDDNDNSDDEINIICSSCNSENPMSYNFCGFCRHPTRIQSPTTFAIHTPQASSRNNTNDISS